MSDTQPPEGAPPVAGGDGNNPPSNPPPEPRKDSVTYDTHRKLLDEKKKLQEKFEALAKEKEDRERKELEDKGDLKKIIELETSARVAAETKLKAHEASLLEAKKVNSLLTALDGAIDQKFWGFLPVDKVIVDPATGEINAASVAEAADIVKKNYPELIRRKAGPGLPHDAPKGNEAGTVSESEWKKFSAKDMGKWKYNQIRWGE